jgi:putative membrane protein
VTAVPPPPAAPGPRATAPQRLHPLTPVAKGGQIATAGLFAAIAFGESAEGFAFRIGIFVVITLVGGLFAAWAWSRTTYWFDDDGDLRIARGILTRSETRVQLSRLQAVEVTRPLIARLVGLADVRPQVSGDGSATKLEFLSERDAHALRNELLARAAGIAYDHAAPAPEAPEQVLVKVPFGDLLTGSILDIGFIVGVVIGVAVLVAAVVLQPEMLLFLVFAIGGPAVAVGTRILALFDFTVAESPDGLRLRSGLLSTQHQTVPPGRVQAVRISQPVLWRGRDWVRLEVNVLGNTTDDQRNGAGTGILLPVAPRPVARHVLSRVLPGLDVEALGWQPAPERSRRRAPLQHRRLAYADDGQVFAARGGWLTPRIDLVPHARTQSVRLTQGPWQRALGLASVEVDSTPGPVLPAALYRDVEDARAIVEVQAERARAARSSATPDRWLAPPPPPRGHVPPPPPGFDQAGLAGEADPTLASRPAAYPAEDVLPDER